jgi:hypothetical protein
MKLSLNELNDKMRQWFQPRSEGARPDATHSPQGQRSAPPIRPIGYVVLDNGKKKRNPPKYVLLLIFVFALVLGVYQVGRSKISMSKRCSAGSGGRDRRRIRSSPPPVVSNSRGRKPIDRLVSVHRNAEPHYNRREPNRRPQ